MRNIMKTVMVATLALLMVPLASSCGGGGGGSSSVASTATDSGSAEGYAYTTVEGDSRVTGRAAGRISKFIPLSGASVVCEGRTTTTNSLGYYKLAGIPAGSRSITITKSGYNPITITVIIIRNQTVTATEQDSDDSALQPAESGSISVVSTPSGATIFLDGQATDFITPNTLDNISTGSHSVYVELDGYDTPDDTSVEVTADGTASADFTLTVSAADDDSDDTTDDADSGETDDSGSNDPVPSAANYVIVDSGQTACYSDSQWMNCPADGAAFFGQDAQYDGEQPSYTDNGDGTVTDNVTGLMWQQDPGEKMTFSQAVAGANSFNLAGYTDWRLPTIKELYSLIMFYGMDPSGYSGTDTSSLAPFIDTDYFDFEYGDTSAGERIIDSQFASSNVYAGDGFDSETVFGVNFADGRIKGYGTTIFGSEKTFFVLYVRGGNDYGVNDFTDNGDGTVTDAATGLMWQQDDSGDGMFWEDALSYCENLTTGGYTDWRLPGVKELQSIVDYTRAPSLGSAAIDPVFNATSITNEGGQTDWGYYWSGTTHANTVSGDAGAYVAFGRGLGYMNSAWVDVHGAGCQRSDPKSGDPAMYPTGFGPQGDARRIYNFARCVRGGPVKFSDTKGRKPEDTTYYKSTGSLPRQGGSHQGGMTGAPPLGNAGSPDGMGGSRPQPPQEAFDACDGADEGDSCAVNTPRGALNGTCVSGISSQGIVCVPEGGPPPARR